MKKKCTKCNNTKLFSDFPKNKSRKDGYHLWCKVCHNKNAQQSYYRNIPSQRNAHLRKRFGITLDIFNTLVSKQRGKCKICDNLFTQKGNGKPCVDHDHKKFN